MDYFGIPSLCAQDEALTERSSPTNSVVDKMQESPAASAFVDLADGGNHCDLEDNLRTHDVKPVGAKRALRHVKHSYRI